MSWTLPVDFTRLLPSAAPKPKPAPAPKPPVGVAIPPDQLSLSTSTGATPRAGNQGGRIDLGVKSRWVKDPSFANFGQPIGQSRYMAFGDLRQFYLKGFSVEGAKGLQFKGGEIPLNVKGLPPGLDGLWAPQVVVEGDKVRLYYSAGKMPPGAGIDWPSFRLRMAEVPLDDFIRQAKSGKGIDFKDKGALFQDQRTFGGDPSFAMIDPHLYVNPKGEAFMTYTVVKEGIPGKRAHEEFVRYRQVDPKDPTRAIGPDMPMLDGWAGGRHDGVAEAQDVVTLNGKAYAFISSRAGDKDQRVYAASIDPKLGRLQEQALKPAIGPGGANWRSNAVGSTSAAVIDGKPYMLYQGLNAQGAFSLGWTDLAMQ